MRACWLFALLSLGWCQVSGFGFADVRCSMELGVGSHAHDKVVSALDGRSIVFLGDSLIRYNYLSLAYYLAHGVCPDKKTDPEHFILDEAVWKTWEEFYIGSSRQLTASTEVQTTSEDCFCARPVNKPGRTHENRVFNFVDAQGRRIQLSYIQYFTEHHVPLLDTLDAAHSLNPSDIVLGWGLWLQTVPPDCPADPLHAPLTPYETPSEPGKLPSCPPIAAVCTRFKADRYAALSELSGESVERAARPHLWWATPLPLYENGKLLETLGDSHPLDVRAQCRLPDSAVIDRRGALDDREPNRGKQTKFYTEEFQARQIVHIGAEANHIFNHILLEKLATKPPRTTPFS